MAPADVLSAFEVRGHSSWYTIGTGERRVTVHTQQVRALNLAWAIKQSNKLSDGPFVVIGGGAAGLTVAAGLAHLGAQVTVLEKADYPMPLQRHCYKRHLHPHIFDWPNFNADNPFADLPLLNWKAGMARTVALSIEAAFQELCFARARSSNASKLELRLGAKDIRVDAIQRGMILFRKNSKVETLHYGTLIYALGFGVENSFWGGHRGSYWADDSLDQHGIFPPGKYLISGVGDGGLIDLLRIVTKNLRQEDLARLIATECPMEKLREKLKELEGRAENAAESEAGRILFEGYAALPEELTRGLDAAIKEKLNSDVHVTLLSRSASPFSVDSRPLHKLLLSRLLFSAAHLLTIQPGVDLKEEMLRRDRNKVILTLGEEMSFDHAVIRHGPSRATLQFPSLDQALNTRPRALDIDEAYDPKEFGSKRGRGCAIAWADGPQEEDYLDALARSSARVRGLDGDPVSINSYLSVHYELRARQQQKPAWRSPEQQYEPSHARQDLLRNETKQWEEEVKNLHQERYWRRLPGFAILASDMSPQGVKLLTGHMGTGKSTLLRLIAKCLLDKHRKAPTKHPVPVWIGVPEITDTEYEALPAVLADAAVRSAELASYSRAASWIQSKIMRKEVVLFFDAVDGWSSERLETIVHWAQNEGIAIFLAARRAPFEFGERERVQGARHYELLGIAPSSTTQFIQICLGDPSTERADQVLKKLASVVNADEWRSNPFLLTIATKLFSEHNAWTAGDSTLALFEKYLALFRAPGGLDDAALDLLSRFAQEDLRKDPPRLYFLRERIPFRHRSLVLSSGIVSGEKVLEFSHLSIGEYLASAPCSFDAASARRRLKEVSAESSWQHQLEVLPMAHARQPSELLKAFEEAQIEDPWHLQLVLILRAIAYGGSETGAFCAAHGSDVVVELSKRMSTPSARFGFFERGLLRAFDRAAPFFTNTVFDAGMFPSRGEPGAEAWGVAAALKCEPGKRPPGSHWWPTAFHQARVLLPYPPGEVMDRTRGGSPWDRRNALIALGVKDKFRALLLDRESHLREQAMKELYKSGHLGCLGMLADENEDVRAQAVRAQPDGFWSGPGRQSVLTRIADFDPSPFVKAEALKLLEDIGGTEKWIERLDDLLNSKRKMVSGGEIILERVLLRRLADDSRAKPLIDAFLKNGADRYWDCDAYRELYKKEERAEILRTRLETGNPHPTVVDAAKGDPNLVESLRKVVSRFLQNPRKSMTLVSAIRALPKNDTHSREDRLASLNPVHITDGMDEAAYIRSSIRVAAISSFESDPDAAHIILPFLEQTQDDGAAAAAMKVLCKSGRYLDLVLKQLKEGGERASKAAVELLAQTEEGPRLLKDYYHELSNAAHLASGWRGHQRVTILQAVALHEKEWISNFINDPDLLIREAAIRILLDYPPAEDALRNLVFLEQNSAVQASLWCKFSHDSEIRAELERRAVEDQWEVRHAYFSMLSSDESRLDELRAFLAEVIKDPKLTDLLPALARALARDEKARPALHSLVDSPDGRRVAVALRVLKDDPKFRDIVIDRVTGLTGATWMNRLSIWAEKAFYDFFKEDSEFKKILLKMIQGSQLPPFAYLIIPLLRGYAPAVDTLKLFMSSDVDYIASAARAALVDDPSIREALVQELRNEDSSVRRKAAERLEDSEEAQEALADRIDDDDNAIRRIAFSARRRLGKEIQDAENRLSKESDVAIRCELIAALAASKSEQSLSSLRRNLATDFARAAREQASKGLRRAEPFRSLREALRDVWSEGDKPSQEVNAYISSPLRLSQIDNASLFYSVVGWICAKLVSTIPQDSQPMEIDALPHLFGEIVPEGIKCERILLRLAADASDLPRDRNVWPAANFVLAWDVAQHLRCETSLTIILACADVHSGDLQIPELDPGEVCVGPTFFGFRLLPVERVIQKSYVEVSEKPSRSAPPARENVTMHNSDNGSREVFLLNNQWCA